MKILVVKEKHGDYYYDASTDELLDKTCRKILQERLKDGWYDEDVRGKVIKQKIGISEYDIGRLPEGPVKILALSELEKIRKEDIPEGRFIKDVKRCLETPHDSTAKPAVKTWAYELLNARSRQGYEYEEIDLVEAMSV